MSDHAKTKAQLIAELDALRQRIAALEHAEAECDQMEAALRENEARWRSLIDTMPQGFGMHDQDNISTYANDAFCTMLGYSREEIVGRNLNDFMAPDSLAELQRQLEQQKTGGSALYDVVWIGKDGRRVHTLISPRSMFDGEGNFTGSFAVVTDITALKQAEAQLQTLNRSYQRMFDDHVAVMLLIDPDTGAIVNANAAACAYYGYSRDDIVAMNIADINQLSAAQIYEEMARARTEQRTHFVFRHALASGEIRDVEVRSGPVEWEGRTLLFSIIHDITERKRAENALCESEATLRALLNALTDSVLLLSSDGTIHQLNATAARRFDKQPEALIGTKVWELMPPELAASRRERSIEVLQTGQPVRFDDQRAGVWYETSIYPVFDANDAVTRVAVVARDITDRKDAELRQREHDIERERIQILQRFIGDASHDLRTPLTTIKARLYLLRKRPDQWERHLDVLNMQTMHLEKLLVDMLSMFRLDQAVHFSLEMLDINALMRDVIARQQPLAQQKQHTLRFEAGDDLPLLRADKRQLAHAIINVVTNALQFTPDGGTVTLRTYRQDRRVVVEVQDTGIGIAPEHLPHVFERFFRVDQTRNTVRGGAGLGLSIAKRIIDAHQGQINVESAVGTGSTFRILLPSDNTQG